MIATTTEDLPCPLTEDEVSERAQELTNEIVELDKFLAGAREVRKELKNTEEKRNKRIRVLSDAVRMKMESRPIECRIDANVARRRVEIVRIDTGELVRTRPMTPEELSDVRQLRLVPDKDDDDAKH